MPNRDPLGYYRALNVEPGASVQEIKLAYQFLKTAYHEQQAQLDIGTIRAAYQTLTTPAERRRYDLGRAGRGASPVLTLLTSNSTAVLLVLLAVALATSIAVFGPSLRASVTSFEAGDTLVWGSTGEAVGTVTRRENTHEFPGGAVGPAYEVRVDGTLRWYPAGDLERHARRP